MGIFVDYTLRAECSDEELRDRLERVRARCLDLPLRAVGEVRRIEPVYNPVTFDVMKRAGCAPPEEIASIHRQVEEDRRRGDLALCFSTMLGPKLPRRDLNRYFAPALALLRAPELWRSEDLPDEVADYAGPFKTLTIYRRGLEMEFADLLLRYGYLLLVHPGEGSETVALALSTYRRPEGRRYRKPPLWWGQSFTKTQYAKNFILAHENVCRIMDLVADEGLLDQASDTCGYYASRSWKDASKVVNEELTLIGMASSLIGLAVGNMREEGVKVRVLEDNASTAKPVDFSAALAREQAEKE